MYTIYIYTCMCILLYMYCGRQANINMETFMLTGFKFESPQQYWIPDNHFMRLNVSCLLTAQRDFSYFETFWSEFKPENGQLVQNKADTKAYVGVFFHLVQCQICVETCIVFLLHLSCISMTKRVFVWWAASLHRRFPILSSQFQG